MMLLSLKVYDEALTLILSLDESHFNGIKVDLLIGKGESLQRLMNYKEAHETFLSVCSLDEKGLSSFDICLDDGKINIDLLTRTSKAACCAATCLLRLKKYEEAENILRKQYHIEKKIEQCHGRMVDANVSGMLGSLRFAIGFHHKRQDVYITQNDDNLDPIKLLKYSSSCEECSHLHAWLSQLIAFLIHQKVRDKVIPSTSRLLKYFSTWDKKKTDRKEWYTQLALCNLSPFDNPEFIHLDDKVLLHKHLYEWKKLTSYKQSYFWPEGFILPDENDTFNLSLEDQSNRRNQWILKSKAGYGSHGNQIVTGAEALSLCNSSSKSQYLCQMMVDPPLLYHHRKFSLRIYVVCYYTKGTYANKCYQIYLSKVGLMKLASEPYTENATNTNGSAAYMTNSGRDEDMMQLDLQALQSYLDENFEIYDELWSSIKDTVVDLMISFAPKMSTNGMESTLPFIPKIFGFDYMINASYQPYLIEVNRFPGLEPRDHIDRPIKYELLDSAWELAAHLTKLYADGQLTDSMKNYRVLDRII